MERPANRWLSLVAVVLVVGGGVAAAAVGVELLPVVLGGFALASLLFSVAGFRDGDRLRGIGNIVAAPGWLFLALQSQNPSSSLWVGVGLLFVGGLLALADSFDLERPGDRPDAG